MSDAQAKKDAEDVADAEKTLRTEWGEKYEKNHAIATGYIRSLPRDVRYCLMHAVREDGSLLFNTADGVRWLFDLATQNEILCQLTRIESLIAERLR